MKEKKSNRRVGAQKQYRSRIQRTVKTFSPEDLGNLSDAEFREMFDMSGNKTPNLLANIRSFLVGFLDDRGISADPLYSGLEKHVRENHLDVPGASNAVDALTFLMLYEQTLSAGNPETAINFLLQSYVHALLVQYTIQEPHTLEHQNLKKKSADHKRENWNKRLKKLKVICNEVIEKAEEEHRKPLTKELKFAIVAKLDLSTRTVERNLARMRKEDSSFKY